ncbi:unnamed protein product [Rotaria sp. Silwood1]|nr:unnamed protein product [Rotaria sp. Silwood1]CAF3474112.1 unnamed protein product [Rotaria sp. Silwood1]CAF3481731.1 unnamed protein product [Rotaria sp. Silwood1]CAF3487095.1 unnamed protein product [Rotaria sp. Silwood1]CAF4650368.1 unnamed protein product [Rotaria sp. Silwood1]
MSNLQHLTINSVDTYFGNLKNILERRIDDYNVYCYILSTYKLHKPSIYMNGRTWEEIIVNHLPKLKTFRLKMKIQYWSRNNKKDDIDTLLTSFGSHFWIRERQWFVRCDWHPEPTSSYICLYTLPYAFDHFDTHTVLIQSKSTSPNENDYWLYNRVHNLHYHFSLTNSSALSRACFPNIHHLSIELPSTDNIWFALSTFIHLNSVDVFILNDEVETYNQLQILLDRAPNLYSLKLICGKFSLPELALFKISSVSVRRLDLYGYIEYNDWQWFNKEQCLALSNSPLGIQCEVLRIKIENPIDVLELVYSMSHLRALNVQILNDPHNIPGLELPQTEDELLQFFQSSLDSTCILTRNEYDPRFIQLWIR